MLDMYNLGKPETHKSLSRIAKGAEGTVPASHALYEIVDLVNELGSDELKAKMNKVLHP